METTKVFQDSEVLCPPENNEDIQVILSGLTSRSSSKIHLYKEKETNKSVVLIKNNIARNVKKRYELQIVVPKDRIKQNLNRLRFLYSYEVFEANVNSTIRSNSGLSWRKVYDSSRSSRTETEYNEYSIFSVNEHPIVMQGETIEEEEKGMNDTNFHMMNKIDKLKVNEKYITLIFQIQLSGYYFQKKTKNGVFSLLRFHLYYLPKSSSSKGIYKLANNFGFICQKIDFNKNLKKVQEYRRIVLSRPKRKGLMMMYAGEVLFGSQRLMSNAQPFRVSDRYRILNEGYYGRMCKQFVWLFIVVILILVFIV